MREGIKFTLPDNEWVLLETQGGQQFRVAVFDKVETAEGGRRDVSEYLTVSAIWGQMLRADSWTGTKDERTGWVRLRAEKQEGK